MTQLTLAQPANTVLDWRGSKAALMQAGFVAAAVALPSLCHFFNASFRAFLPMHWPVMAAGLVYGWRGGLAVGFVSPLVSFALSGMAVPLMCPELAAYGFAAGFARQNLRLNGYAALLLAAVFGRLAYAASASFLLNMPLAVISAALAPGLAAGLAQVVLLPGLAGIWTKAK